MSKRGQLEREILGTIVSTFWINEELKQMQEKAFSYAINRLRPQAFIKDDFQELFRELQKGFRKGKSRYEIIESLPEKFQNLRLRLEDFELYDFDRFKGVVEALVEEWIRDERENIGILLKQGKITEDEAIKMLADLEKLKVHHSKPVKDACLNILKELEDERVNAVPTFIEKFEEYFSFRPGQVSIIGARPGVGKTALAVAMSYEQMQAGYKVLFFSLELPEEDLVKRYISYVSGVPLKLIQQKRLTTQQKSAIVDAVGEIESLPLEIYDNPNLTIQKFKAKILEVKPDIVYIDYVQKFIPHRRFNSLREFLNEVSIELTNAAKQFEVPIVALAQLSREAEKKDEEPKMSHLKETGQLEQDASVIIMLHRDPKKSENNLKLMVVKNREGEIPPHENLPFKKGFPVLDGNTEIPEVDEKAIEEAAKEMVDEIEF